jgi:site-specific DNA-methyltransferase (adenine-specific)
MKNKEKRVHPTQKPSALAEWCFENYGMPSIVLGLFLGSGSTLIACEKTNRKCFGMELDEQYCDVIVKRYITFCKKNNKPYSVLRNGEPCTDFEELNA